MRVLLTHVADRRFGDRVRAVAPDAEQVIMAADGSLHLAGGDGLDWGAADVEVAWATADLFARDAPIRAFFGFVSRSRTLRWLQSPAAGVDDPIFADLVRRGVRVTSAHVNSIPIAEFVLRAALDHAQEAWRWRDAQQRRAWDRHDFRELFDSTWLIIGVGSIGAEVATRARAFAAHIIGVRRDPAGDEPVDEMITPDAIAAAVPRADVVVVAAPATAQTHRLVDRSFLASMKPGSLLINIARGTIVDEHALVQALDAGVPDAAVLDVFATEPLPEGHALWSHPKVTVTAHNAAGGTGRYRRAADLFTDNLARYLAGQPLQHEVSADDLLG